MSHSIATAINNAAETLAAVLHQEFRDLLLERLDELAHQVAVEAADKAAKDVTAAFLVHFKLDTQQTVIQVNVNGVPSPK